MNEHTTTAVQPELFPLSEVKTEGFAAPEPVDDAEADDGIEPGAEAA